MREKKQIKAFFFDIGGVLVRVDSKRAIENLSTQLHVSVKRIQDAMSRDLLTQYEKGHLNSNQFYENLLINCESGFIHSFRFLPGTTFFVLHSLTRFESY